VAQEQQDGQQQQSRWRPARKQLLWTGAAVTILTVAIVIGYRYDVTLWDWIKLLIVPAVIAGGGFWFNRQQRERELEIAREQREREQRIANERAQDEALQGYLDGMSQLLTDKDLPLHSAKPRDSLSTVARARTLTVLERLDSGRKRSVLQFLYESRLIDRERTFRDKSGLIETRHNIVSLDQADLSGADLSATDLSAADLSRANLRGAGLSEANLIGAHLREAHLSEADLFEADLFRAHLSEADLFEANLIRAGLTQANLSGANLRESDMSEADLFEANLRVADMSGTKLWGAYLRGADLSRANLSVVDMRGANLSEADMSRARGWTKDQLSEAMTIKGATMPDGQILQYYPVPDRPTFEEWLKSRGRKEDGQNDGSS
jgi:uncharacterized protein YjbI with pentapeptide repeats